MAWNEGPLLGFDLETTGLDPSKDLPVQVALVSWEPHQSCSREVFIVDPGREIPAGAEAIHGISTLKARRHGCPLEVAAATVHRALRKAQAARIPVVAMNASFDVTIAARLFRRFELEPLAWDALIDPLVIDRRVNPDRCGNRRLEALCEIYGVVLSNPHDAGDDADATVALVRVIAERYPEIAACEIRDLTRLQARWHLGWALDHDARSRESGGPGLGVEELFWPLRERSPAARR